MNVKQAAEDATGIRESGKLVFYDKRGIKMPLEEAREVFCMGESVEVPQAGAGSFHEVFKALGFKEVKVIDWTSSAGDWCFGVKKKDGWAMAYQENRFPFYGFKYVIDNGGQHSGYSRFDDLVQAVMDI